MSTTNNKVAFFVKSFPKLSETFILSQITGLIDQGIDVDIIALEPSYEEKVHQSYYDYDLASKTTYLYQKESTSAWSRLLQRGTTFTKLLLAGRIRDCRYILDSKLHPYFSRSLYLCRFLSTPPITTDYQMIIAHFGPDGSLAIKLRELGVIKGPIATVFHGFDMSDYQVIEQYKKAYQEVFQKGELMLPISHLWKNRLIEWGCDSKKIHVHRMGVPLDDMPQRPFTSPIHTPLKLVCVGRMTEKKGIRYAIEGVTMARQHIDVELDIIGGGEELTEMQALITSLKANDFIRCHGAQTQEFVKRYLSDSDVFLLPSVTAQGGDMEGIPVALMESMASGLITLTTRHSGIPELVKDGENGYLTDEKAPEQICNKIIEISKLSSEEAASVRASARQMISTEFDNNNLNKQLAQITKTDWNNPCQ